MENDVTKKLRKKLNAGIFSSLALLSFACGSGNNLDSSLTQGPYESRVRVESPNESKDSFNVYLNLVGEKGKNSAYDAKIVKDGLNYKYELNPSIKEEFSKFNDLDSTKKEEYIKDNDKFSIKGLFVNEERVVYEKLNQDAKIINKAYEKEIGKNYREKNLAETSK